MVFFQPRSCFSHIAQANHGAKGSAAAKSNGIVSPSDRMLCHSIDFVHSFDLLLIFEIPSASWSDHLSNWLILHEWSYMPLILQEPMNHTQQCQTIGFGKDGFFNSLRLAGYIYILSDSFFCINVVVRTRYCNVFIDRLCTYIYDYIVWYMCYVYVCPEMWMRSNETTHSVEMFAALGAKKHQRWACIHLHLIHGFHLYIYIYVYIYYIIPGFRFQQGVPQTGRN